MGDADKGDYMEVWVLQWNNQIKGLWERKEKEISLGMLKK